MRHSSRTVVLAFLAAVVAALTLGAIRSARSSEPLTGDVCLDCHEDAAHAMMGTAHDPAGKIVSCLDCHAGAATEAHVDDPEANKPMNPATASADSMKALCSTCHAHPHSLNLVERDPHDAAGLACNACHQIHDNTHAYQLKHEEKDLCLSCHPGVRGSFALPSHHPVMDGVIECMDCHTDVAQSAKQRAAGGPGETCVQCHGRFQGPFPYEHEAAVDYSVNDGGCLNCHNPHGSTFPMLLKQSYEAPHYSLCSQCHSVPKHLNSAQHGTQWAGVPCGDCHVDVHGSYVNRNLLDSSLQTQGCFLGGGGCHQF
jgi:DmsE family decaheme c-type cytochrome